LLAKVESIAGVLKDQRLVDRQRADGGIEWQKIKMGVPRASVLKMWEW